MTVMLAGVFAFLGDLDRLGDLVPGALLLFRIGDLLPPRLLRFGDRLLAFL